MGILITTYKSLPEQVEANKEKCADLQEQINNIDTHEIEEIKQQVEDNTHDINSLTNGLSVTNGLVANHTQRLNGLDTEVSSLETKTTYISKVGNDTKFSTNVNVEGSINSVDGISTDGIISAGSDIISESVIKGQVLVAENDNGEGRFAIDNDGDMNLYNPANAGKLITTGNIEEYAPQTHLYEHNITLYINSATSGYGFTTLTLVTNSNTQLTMTTFKEWLYNNGFTTLYKAHACNGTQGNDTDNFQIISGIFITSATGNIQVVIRLHKAGTMSVTSQNLSYQSSYTFTDTVRQIS